jgi:hypothetical protein
MNACTVGRVPEKEPVIRQNEIPPTIGKDADFYFKKNSGLGARVDAMTAPASRAGCFPGERYPPPGGAACSAARRLARAPAF